MAAALVLLVGGAVAFAGQALDNGPGRPPAATAPPPPALTLLAPSESITRRARTTLVALRPAGLRADQPYSFRVYVNGSRVREDELPDSESFEVPNIALEQGPNTIDLTLVGDGGEGPRSTAVTILRDDVEPPIHISQPSAGETVYADSVLLRGRTEAGAQLTIARAESDREIETSLGDDGRFSALVELRMGANQFVLRSTDVAGNRSSTRLTIVRADSTARLSLSISPELIDAATLPVSVTISATVRDEVGRLVDGADVTFGVSPPSRSTTTYQVATTNGRARWSGLTLSPGDASGVWLVTVSATLPSGVELRQNGSFSVE